MSAQIIANSYAKALVQVTQERKNSEIVHKELAALAKAWKESQVSDYFHSPLLTVEQKQATLTQSIAGQKLSQEVQNLLQILCDRDRLFLVEEIHKAYERLLDKEMGLTRGVIRAAQPLSQETQAHMEKKITETLKQKVVLSFKEDPSLLGGIVAQVGGWTFDDSVETHLLKMNEELIKN